MVKDVAGPTHPSFGRRVGVAAGDVVYGVKEAACTFLSATSVMLNPTGTWTTHWVRDRGAAHWQR